MTTDNDSVRADFEKAFPAHDGVYWHEGNRRYQRTADYAIRAMIAHQKAFEAWQASRERYVPRWISVEEGLPSLGDNVLVMMPSGINVGALIDEGEGWLWSIAQYISGNLSESECICDDDYSSITHWMPLPATPNGGNGS